MSLNEDNVRIVLLASVLCVYLAVGALIIEHIEHPAEEKLIEDYKKMFREFEIVVLNSTNIDYQQFIEMLYAHGNLTTRGLSPNVRRWNFLGSIQFVATIITTVGYGSYTPNTTAGKIFVILYGLLGCSLWILMLNLFLERIITLLAFMLRSLYLWRLSRKENPDPGEASEEWKPSIYWVMVCLMVMTAGISGISVLVYTYMEGWSYIDSTYFCFVSVSTIGFGDFVTMQNVYYPFRAVYIVLNVFLLVSGCCCIYSLFNVVSIILKQFLSWIVENVDCRNVCGRKDDPDRILRKYSLKMQRERDRRRRSSVTLNKVLKKSRSTFTSDKRGSMCNNLATNMDEYSAADSRKLSDGLISLKDFLTSNHISLAMMQKELYESAQMSPEGSSYRDRPTPATGRFVPGTIGPLAILCNKLGDKK